MNPAIEAIDRQRWLDGVAETVQPALRNLLEQNGALKDLLHGKFLGHPLHPVLVDIPVGSWTAAAVCDAIELMTGSEALSDAGDFCVGFGIAGALGSAVAGIADWSETDGRPRRIGVVHGMLNVAATACYATALAMRRSESSRRAGIGLSLLGYAIASMSAYLGGHLVFGEGVGVKPPARPTPA